MVKLKRIKPECLALCVKFLAVLSPPGIAWTVQISFLQSIPT